MESLEMTLFGNQYQGRRVLLTGHTGFKGSWLALWLAEMEAEVTGLALPPETNPNHWSLLGLNIKEYRDDIRSSTVVSQIMAEVKPQIIFHLAAQPLVRRSYREPLETWSTNVLGTANILEAARQTAGVEAIVVVTTDKCYENKEWSWGYRETDRLGGHDPYSASKAATELLVESYRKAFFHGTDKPLIATARAGNVIGGGDWSEDRLIPDLVRAIANRSALEIRSPQATRPWQHVLEPLSGYLRLGQKLLEGQSNKAQSWNFGPESEGNRSVGDMLTALNSHWPELTWRSTPHPQPHEANLLYLDSSKARMRLDWRPIWNLNEALAATADWYRTYYANGYAKSRNQLANYIAAAHQAAAKWCNP